jgi:tetratricopeptide (TPR) repeat protein
MVSGPHESFPKNPYTAYFEIAVADNSVDDVVVTIEVSTRRGKVIFAQKSLRGVDFSEAGQYELVPLSFVLEEDIHDLETRVFFHDRVDVSVKKVYIEPDLAELYYKAGVTAFRNAHYRDAKILFLRAVAVSPHVLARYQLGVIAQLFGNKREAIELFRQIIKERPDFADAYYRLGILVQEQGNLEYAHQYLKKATELLPAHLDAWQALQKVFQELAREAEAKNIQQMVAMLDHPQYPHAVNFGNQVIFLGYTIQNSSPGKLLIDYYWKALSSMDKDYVFFIHFKQFYRTRFQQDHEPQRIDFLTGRPQYHPTSRWQVGELVHEQFEITAPAGTYTVYLGVWDPLHTKKRLPVISSSQKSFFTKKELELKKITVK